MGIKTYAQGNVLKIKIFNQHLANAYQTMSGGSIKDGGTDTDGDNKDDGDRHEGHGDDGGDDNGRDDSDGN